VSHLRNSYAFHSDCHHYKVFFDARTEADRVLCDKGYIAARNALDGLVAPPPREAGAKP
jgi:hypothetical protein